MKMDRLDGWNKIISKDNQRKLFMGSMMVSQSFLVFTIIIPLSLDKLMKTSKEGDDMDSYEKKRKWPAYHRRMIR